VGGDRLEQWAVTDLIPGQMPGAPDDDVAYGPWNEEDSSCIPSSANSERPERCHGRFGPNKALMVIAVGAGH
jgi:hypothetical protein